MKRICIVFPLAHHPSLARCSSTAAGCVDRKGASVPLPERQPSRPTATKPTDLLLVLFLLILWWFLILLLLRLRRLFHGFLRSSLMIYLCHRSQERRCRGGCGDLAQPKFLAESVADNDRHPGIRNPPPPRPPQRQPPH